MNLHFQAAGAGPPLIILHGLLGSADNWLSAGARLAADFRVLALDLRNHGRSPHSDRMDYEVMAADVDDFMRQHDLPSAAVLGHSMGGKVAMRLALDRPEKVDKLIVVDIAPKPYGPSQRRLLETLRALDLSSFRSFGEVESALADDVQDAALRRFLVKNIARDESRRFGWKIDLDAICRNYDRLTDWRLTAGAFDKPALFIRGGRSRYVDDADIPVILASFPMASITALPSGHWVHSEVPDEFHSAVSRFLGA